VPGAWATAWFGGEASSWAKLDYLTCSLDRPG